MKKIALVSAIALGSLFYNKANAQILQIGLHLGGGRPAVEASYTTPVAVNYSNADDYYYLPDVDAYYSVPERVYYYNNGYNWVSAAALPGEYCNYDWRAARHYEVRAARPFLRADFYRERYSGRAYDWRRYNDRYDNRYDGRRDDRFDNRYDARRNDRFDRRDDRRDDRFDDRRDNRMNQQPVFGKPYNQPRGGEHAQGNWNNGDNHDRYNQGGRGNDYQQNDNRYQQQRNDDHFASDRDHGRHGFAF